jgi:hypothetical protein
VVIDGLVPDRRSNHAMCFDPVRKQVVMTGGENVNGYLSDTWLFTSTGPGQGTWTRGPDMPNTPQIPVAGRSGHTMVFDEREQISVLMGGAVKVDGDEYIRAEVLGWDGSSWSPYQSGLLPGFGIEWTEGLSRHPIPRF